MTLSLSCIYVALVALYIIFYNKKRKKEKRQKKKGRASFFFGAVLVEKGSVVGARTHTHTKKKEEVQRIR